MGEGYEGASGCGQHCVCSAHVPPRHRHGPCGRYWNAAPARPAGLARAGHGLRRTAGAGTVDAGRHAVHPGLHPQRPRAAREHRPVQCLAVAAVGGVLGCDGRVCNGQLAPRWPDAGHAAMAVEA
ncbi:hypothetical protein G6F68_011810 [Rhizopus microsporus]|nr:hypothetical protein G6F68_011810 [Rhizopus microsporus]